MPFGEGPPAVLAQWRPLDIFPSSLEAASRQREEVSSAYMKVCEMVMGMGGRACRLHRSGHRSS